MVRSRDPERNESLIGHIIRVTTLETAGKTVEATSNSTVA